MFEDDSSRRNMQENVDLWFTGGAINNHEYLLKNDRWLMGKRKRKQKTLAGEGVRRKRRKMQSNNGGQQAAWGEKHNTGRGAKKKLTISIEGEGCRIPACYCCIGEKACPPA